MDASSESSDMCSGSALFGTGAASSRFELPGATDQVGFSHDDDFIASFEPGGALLHSAHWSMSASKYGETVQWNAITDGLFDPWAQKLSGANAPRPDYPNKAKSTNGNFTQYVKPDPDEAQELVATCSRTGTQASDISRDHPPTAIGAEPKSEIQSASHPAFQALGVHDAGHEVLSSSAGQLQQQRSRAAAVFTFAQTPAMGKERGDEIDKEVEAEADDGEEENEKDNEDEEDFEKSDHEGIGTRSELSEKRRRNREHAKRSRMRKRVRLGGLEEMVLELRRENVRLRQIVKKGIPDRADDIIRTCASDNTDADLVAKQDVVQGMRPSMAMSGSSGWGSRLTGGSRSRPKLENGSRHSGGRDRRVPSALKLMSPSYQSVKALSESQANFILTNPNLPGCPIIFASPGFLELTGYEASQVIGKNCRLLQGPGTDPVTVSIIRNNLAQGRDTSVCILNYKADGTPFWNQLSIGNLLDSHGQVANNVGVLCEVKQMPAADFHRLLHRVPLPESLLNDTSSDSGDDNQDSKGYGCSNLVDGRYMDSGSGRVPAYPRVVDRLRRTRAASAADQAAMQNSA